MSGYDELKKLLTGNSSALPVNRKERFYTSTVLPSLLFCNGLHNLIAFLSSIEGLSSYDFRGISSEDFLFYTEYNMKESCGDRNVGRRIDVVTKETPDILMQFFRPIRCFVVIEAKMFSNVLQPDFDSQMERQGEVVIDTLRSVYTDTHLFFHVALVPRAFSYDDRDSYQVLHWDDFVSGEKYDVEGSLFYKYLKFAMDNYDYLRAKKTSFLSGISGKKSGRQICLDVEAGLIYHVGREGGVERIKQDVTGGTWLKQQYVFNPTRPNRCKPKNWISAEQFAAIVKELAKQT